MNKKTLFENQIRIIQSSPKGTGSTLLINIIYGLIIPNKPIKFLNDENIKNNVILKSHNLDFDELEKKYSGYKLFFVVSERDDKKIDSKYYGRSNFIIFNYNDLVNKPVDKMIIHVKKLLKTKFNSLKLNNQMAITRINNMNELYEKIKDKPFNYIDYFYHLHGSHRNRPETIEMPYFIPATKPEKRNKNQKIPYIIVQTMKTNKVPFFMYNSIKTWAEKNPEYDYYFFDDIKCEEFIKDNYEETYLLCWKMLKVGAAKADLFRWLFLKKNGGFYLDIDTTSKVSISSFINENVDFVSVAGPQVKYRINHCFIGSTKENMIINKSIEKAISNILFLYKNKKNELLPQDICGPSVLGKTLNILLNRDKEHSFENDMNKVINKKNMNIYIFGPKTIKNYIILKYKDYNNDLKEMGEKHYLKENQNAFEYDYALNIYNSENINYKLMDKKYF